MSPTHRREFDLQEKILADTERAKRVRRKGDLRKAYLLLREAAFLSRDSAKHWTLYGAACFPLGKVEEGEKALLQAAWHWAHQGHIKRALATGQYLSRRKLTLQQPPFAA